MMTVDEKFNSAVKRLTILYLAVLVIVCVFFSSIIYRQATEQARGGIDRQIQAVSRLTGGRILFPGEVRSLREQELRAFRASLLRNLILINTAVAVLGAIACYKLAQNTIKPIKNSYFAQERFSSDASHELRTPLSVIKSEIEVALMDKNLKTSGYRATLESTLEEVGRIEQIVHMLLALSRQQQLDKEKIESLWQLTEEVVDDFRKEGLQVINSSKKQVVTSSRAAVSQIIRILVDNAKKHAGPQPTVEVRLSRSKNTLVIMVRDNGPGVDESEIKDIFDRFYKVDKSRTSKGGVGYGLGLSIAKQLSEAMGGTISASNDDKGFCVTAIIPVV